MTPEELKRLAEIAGLKVSRWYGYFYFSKNDEPPIINDAHIWQPHQRIEQSFMVADGLFNGSRSFRLFYVHPYKLWEASIADSSICETFNARAETPSLAITRAALEALKEG